MFQANVCMYFSPVCWHLWLGPNTIAVAATVAATAVAHLADICAVSARDSVVWLVVY